MRDLSKLTNGSFYYISELNLVEECFIDASTGLSSDRSFFTGGKLTSIT